MIDNLCRKKIPITFSQGCTFGCPALRNRIKVVPSWICKRSRCFQFNQVNTGINHLSLGVICTLEGDVLTVSDNKSSPDSQMICWTRRCRHIHQQLTHLRPRQNGHHFADDIFKCIFLDENVWITIKISPKFVPQGPINNIPALVQIMAWRRPGDKPLSEPMMVRLPTNICATRPQWVKMCL